MKQTFTVGDFDLVCQLKKQFKKKKKDMFKTKLSWKPANSNAKGISSQGEVRFCIHSVCQEWNIISIIYNPQPAHMVCAYKILIGLIS